jgi:putative transcriptional regulator
MPSQAGLTPCKVALTSRPKGFYAVSVNENVRSEVRKLRFLNGEMTQEELAKRVGVSRQTIVAIEKGMYNPSVGLALRIARVFGVPVEEVFILHAGEEKRSSRSRKKGKGAR